MDMGRMWAWRRELRGGTGCHALVRARMKCGALMVQVGGRSSQTLGRVLARGSGSLRNAQVRAYDNRAKC